MPTTNENKVERLKIDIPIRNDNPFEVVNNYSPNWGIMLTMQKNLNLRIGTQIWKKYINATFWNYTSTPINFTITLFSALSAGQTGTGSTYLTSSQLFYILFTTFVLSIANTFFNLKEKAKINYESAKIYESFGYDFEKIYFIPVFTDDDLEIKLNYYRQLQENIDNQSSKESIEYANYITELIFIITKCCYWTDFNFNKLPAGERFWLLDGKECNKYSKNNYPVDMTMFKNDFNLNNKDDKIQVLLFKNSECSIEINKLHEKINKLESSPLYKFVSDCYSTWDSYKNYTTTFTGVATKPELKYSIQPAILPTPNSSSSIKMNKTTHKPKNPRETKRHTNKSITNTLQDSRDMPPDEDDTIPEESTSKQFSVNWLDLPLVLYGNKHDGDDNDSTSSNDTEKSKPSLLSNDINGEPEDEKTVEVVTQFC